MKGDERLALTVPEAAERIGIGQTKVYELVARGDLPSVKIGRCRRIRVQALETWLAEREAAEVINLGLQ